MKSHLRHAALGGVLAPLILAIATAIANGAQEALHLNLHGTALAIFLVGFVAGATLVTTTSVKAEAQKLLGDVGGIGGLVKDLGLADLFGPPAPTSSARVSPPPFDPAELPPPPGPPEAPAP